MVNAMHKQSIGGQKIDGCVSLGVVTNEHIIFTHRITYGLASGGGIGRCTGGV